MLLENTLEDVRNELDSPGAYAEKVENHRIGDSGLVMLLDQDGQLVGISRSFQMKAPEPSLRLSYAPSIGILSMTRS